jgi:outer membrane protein assembly factor BamE (lipoprotein component of BamABCDE complex)
MAVLVLAASVVLPGCYSFGSRAISDDSRLKQLVTGQSTKDEVLGLLGRPTTSFSDSAGFEFWTYHYTQARANAAQFIPLVGAFIPPEVESRSLTLHFGRDGVLERIARSDSHSGLDKSPAAAPAPKSKPARLVGKQLGGAAS